MQLTKLSPFLRLLIVLDSIMAHRPGSRELQVVNSAGVEEGQGVASTYVVEFVFTTAGRVRNIVLPFE